MDHGRLDAKDRQNHESEVVICSDKHVIAGRAGEFSRGAFRILRTAHLRRRKGEAGIAADSDLQILFIGFRQALVVGQTDNDAAGFVFDGWDAGFVNFSVLAITAACDQAVVRAVHAIAQFVLTGGGETYAEARGVFDDQPGVKQPRVLEDPDQQEQQDRQDQGKFQHALG